MRALATLRRLRQTLLAGMLVALVALPAIGGSSAAAATCPCSIWPSTATPGAIAADPGAVELGVKFNADVAGTVTGVRFYKGSGNTGTHVGSLWTTGGQLLAQATFTSESATGWQQVSFSAPVSITANTTYVASYHTNVGHYANDGGFFASAGVDNSPLHALSNSAAGGNGVYAYSASSAFPGNTWQSTNYWVDVVFAPSATPPADTTPPTVTSTSPAGGATGVSATTAVRATFSEAVQPATVSFTLKNPSGATVAATQSYDSTTNTATLSPSAALASSTTYTATVSGATDTAGNVMTAPASWTFTTAASSSSACPCSIWPSSPTPGAIASDPGAVELGVKFRSDVSGSITGVRFYKGTGNTGTHVGSLWSTSGQLLAQATFTTETSTGWQQVTFSSPVGIAANTTYVASYHTDVGHYANDGGYFASAGVDTPPLHALSNSVAGGNGVYAYSGSSAFPANTWNSTNYWVDVVFTTTAAPPPPPPPPSSCGTGVNPIACENSQAGSPSSEWDISGSGSSTIQGFATDISFNRGDTVQFKINTPASSYRIDIYRLGYYGGNGARKIATISPSASLPQSQPGCLSDGSTGLVDCGNWGVSASWPIPAGEASGIHFAKLTRTDGTAGASHIVFIVRDDASRSQILAQTSDTTWQAYNQYGGNSLYTGSPAGRAYKVSYNRPFVTRDCCPQDWVFNAEYPMVRFLESNGYDVTYTTGVDTARRGNLIPQHRVFLTMGHDEYWSGDQRANVESARGAGVSLAFFTGNESFWKTRWESSISAGAASYRTLVSYKESMANAKIDPTSTWTGTWRDPRFSPPSDGGRPENAVSGNLFMVNGPQSQSIVVPAADGRMRFWRNTSIATLAAGTSATLPSGVLGYEWDEDIDNGFRPAGIVHLSTTTLNVSSLLLDYCCTYGSGTATHNLTLYRASSGALVFGAGTIQWAWGLDATHDRSGTTADARMQQATVNVLADMGAQATTLRSGLVAASASTDTTAPTASISSPSSGATLPAGQPVTISGSASDVGGVVGAVEVSTDGATWHPAQGRGSWTYSWTPSSQGSVTLRARAIDDSGNIGAPATATVTVGTTTCPCSIWGTGATPAGISADPGAVELGVKFRADVNGRITGLRFYKGSGNTGTHVGSLWTTGGQLLAQATFVNETASGWQQVTFSSPVSITAGATYVASYHTNVGHYAQNVGYFASTGVDSPPLHALSNSAAGGNGVYTYSGSPSFPASTYSSTNYWVDVVFTTP